MINSINWKLRNKLIVIHFLLSITAIGLVYLSLYLNNYIISTIFTDASTKIFQSESKSQLDKVWIKRANVESILDKTIQQMDMLNELKHFTEKTKSFQIQAPQQCLYLPNTNDTYSYNCSQCFGIFNGKLTDNNTQNYSNILQTTSILTQFRYTIDLEQALYFSTSDPLQFYSITQGFYFPSGFKPHSRPWYQYHINQSQFQTQEYIYGLPYSIFIGGVKAPLTRNLTSNNGKFQGVIARDIDFNAMKLLKISESTFTQYIVNVNGLVVYGQQYSKINQSLFYIYDDLITGFNKQDWNEIINYYNLEQFNNNCEDIKYLPSSTLCRKNSLNNESFILQISVINNSPYILIMYKNIDYFKHQEQKLFSILQEELYQIGLNYLIVDICVIISVLLASYLTIFVIMEQMNYLIQFTQNKVNKISLKSIQESIKDKITNSVTTSVVVLKLFEAIEMFLTKMSQTSNHKSKICKIIEQYPYPKLLRAHQRFRRKIQQFYDQLKNNNKQKTNHRRNLIEFQVIDLIYDDN